MILFWNLRWLILLIIFWQFNVEYVTATWPVLKPSTIHLLGVFQDLVNAPESPEFTNHPRAMFKAAILLAQQYNITIEGQFIGMQVEYTDGKPINTLRSTCKRISASKIVGIVGPIWSREVPIIADLGNRVGIPVISYAATDPDLSNQNVYPAFHRTVPSDNSAALAIAKLFVRFNWTSCVIIYQNDAYGSGGVKAITEAFLKNDLKVANTLVFDIATLSMQDNLKSVLISSATRIVVVWAGSNYTSLILQNALDSDVVGPQFTWLLSATVALKSFNKTFHEKLIGMLTLEPIIANVVHAQINTTLLNAAYNIWKKYEPETFPGPAEVDYYALFAFDAAWILIQSLQKLCSKAINSSYSCTSFRSSSFCFDRRFLNSELFLDTINNIAYLGVSGLIQFDHNVTDRMNGSYYFVRNCQSSSNELNFVPVLNYSDHYGWQEYSGSNVIMWPGSSLRPPTGSAKVEGFKLRIGVFEISPFTMRRTVTNAFGENTTELVGYIPEYIELLRNRMKFIPDIQLIPSNQPYDSFPQAVADGRYDIIIADVTVTSTRREKSDFSNPILENSLRLIMRKTDTVEIDVFLFLEPFARELWLLIGGIGIVAGVLIYLFEKSHDESPLNEKLKEWKKIRKNPKLYACALYMGYSFGSLIGYKTKAPVCTHAGHSITVGLHVLCVVLLASYTANLASELTTLKSKNVISGIDDLKSGKIPPDRIGVRVGSASEAFYLREISGGNRNYYKLKSRKETYDSLLNNIIDVSFLDSGAAEYITNNVYCNLTVIGESFDKGAFGIITPKQWLYAQDFDVNILSLTESGVPENLRKKWFEVKICPVSSKPSAAIEIKSLIGLFVIFLVIVVISFFLCIRQCYTRRQQNANRLTIAMYIIGVFTKPYVYK